MSRIDVRVGADTGPLATGLSKAKGMVGNWSKGIKGKLLGAFAFSTVTTLAKQLLDDAENLADASDRYAVSTEFLQKAANAASVSGSSFGDVEITLKALVRRSQLAIMSNNEYRKSWESLGVSVDQLKGKSPEQLFYMLQDAVGKASDRNTAFKDTVNVAGDSAKNLFALFNMGKEDMDALGESMGVYDEKTTRAMANANVQIRKVWSSMKHGLGVAVYWLIGGIQSLTIAVMGFFKLAYEGSTLGVKNLVAYTQHWWDLFTLLGRIGKAAKAALTGNFADARKELETYTAEVLKSKEALEQTKKQNKGGFDSEMDAFSDAFDEQFDEIWNPKGAEDSRTGPTPDVDAMNERTKLMEKYAEAKKKADFEALTTEGKLNALQKRKAELQKLANDETEEGLQANIALLDIQEQITQQLEKQANEEEKKTKELEKQKEELDRMRESAKEAEDRNAFNKLSEEEQMVALLQKEKELMEQANNKTKEGLQARKDLADVQAEIAKRKEQDKQNAFGQLSDRLSVDSDFLARVGGGGFTSKVPAGTDKLIAEHQRTNQLAQKIHDHITKNDGRGEPSKETVDLTLQ